MLTVKLKRSEIEEEDEVTEEEAKAEEEAQVEDAEEEDAVEEEDEQPEPEILSVKCLDKEGNEISKCPADEPLMFEAVCNDHVDEGARVTFNVYCEGDDPEQDEPVETFSAAVRQNRARVELDRETAGRLVGRMLGELVGGRIGGHIGEAIGGNIGRGLDTLTGGRGRPRFFVTAESAGCEEVQSECVEVEEEEGSVIPIVGTYTQQGGGRPVGGTEWHNQNLPHTNSLMSDVGCAPVLMANIAHTHGRTDITPATIIANTEDFESEGRLSGAIRWGDVGVRIGLPHNRNTPNRVRNQILTLAEYNRLNERDTRCFIGLEVFFDDRADAIHWVGLVAPTTASNGTPCYIISPTSDSDTAPGNVRFQATGGGWIRENEQTLVPIGNRIRGYIVFDVL